jgi:hypothetical protein
MEQVVPIRVHLFDQLNFPFSGPMLDVLLPLHCVHEQWIFLIENQSAQSVSACEPCNCTLAMLKRTSANIGGDACVKHTMRSICHDVTNAGCHGPLNAKKMTASSAVMMREDKPVSNRASQVHQSCRKSPIGPSARIQDWWHQDRRVSAIPSDAWCRPPSAW